VAQAKLHSGRRARRNAEHRHFVQMQSVEQAGVSIGLSHGRSVHRQRGAKVAKSGRSNNSVSIGYQRAGKFDSLIEAAPGPMDHKSRHACSGFGVFNRAAGSAYQIAS
jgi:hypothetical protein